MRTRLTLICALLLMAAPAVSWAQYSEKWSAQVIPSPGTSLIPGSIANVDADPAVELVVNDNGGGNIHHVLVLNPITGVVEFTSNTGSVSGAFWTIYLVNLDADAADEILATDGRSTLVIDYAGALGVTPGGTGGSLQELQPAQPNPFDTRTSLAYSLPTAAKAEIEVFDVAGRMVRRLGGTRMPPGTHQLDWDGRDQQGHTLQPGMYLYRLSVDGHATEARKTVRLGS